MNLTFKILTSELKKLYLRYNQFFDESRITLQTEAYFDMLKRFDETVVVRTMQDWEEDKFPTAVQIARKCREIMQKRKLHAIPTLPGDSVVIDGNSFAKPPSTMSRCEFNDHGVGCDRCGVINTTGAWMCRKHHGRLTGHEYGENYP